MGDILKKINVNLLEEVEISVEELVEDYSSKLHNLNILMKESPKYKSDAIFNSSVWIFYSKDTSKYSYIDFSPIEDMNKLGLIDEDDYQIIKCWLVDVLIDKNLEGKSLRSYASPVINLFIETQGLKQELTKSKKGNAIKTFIDYSNSRGTKEDKVKTLTSYANFVEKIGFIKDSHEILLKTVFEYRINHKKANSRKLPSNSSIFTFDYCIKDFFEGDNDPLLKKIYYPIWIWWKITNVIPMRPNELMSKTTRDCLFKNENKYYLKVNRIKIKRTVYTMSKPMIPILNKLEIDKETYDLIKEYIDLTDFAESYTLFSWNAMNEFKIQYMDIKTSDKYKGYLPNFIYDKTTKYNPLAFEDNSFRHLLDSFYSNIIKIEYGYNFKDNEKLAPGDTRHLAFSSLYLQGLSPIEIAMIGGHTTLEMQDSYTNHVQYYIDNEILNFISDKSTCGENAKMFNNLKDIVSSKPWGYELDIDLSDFEKTDDGIGYCLLDTKREDTFCDDVPCCAFCSKWWCEPTNDSYKTIRDYILNNEISPLQSEINIEEKFFVNLINESKIVNLNGLAELDKSDDEALKSQSLKIRAKANKLAFLKASLLERKFEKE